MEQDLSLVGLEGGIDPFEEEAPFTLHNFSSQTPNKSFSMDITLGAESIGTELTTSAPIQVNLLYNRSCTCIQDEN